MRRTPVQLIAESQDYERGGTQRATYTGGDVVDVVCPLCGGDKRVALYVEHDVIGVTHCSGCGLIYTSPRLRSPETIYFGSTERYYAEARLIFEGRASHHRDPNYRAELATIGRFKQKGRFLDVGCNMGMLLRLAARSGWEAVGLEPSPSLSSLAARHGFRVHNCYLHELAKEEEGSFDVVALSDVFEHITSPLAFLGDVQRLMKPDGVMYVKVPNARWNLLKQTLLALAGRHPTSGLWDSYEHVVHYTDRTLRRMLTAAGLRVTWLGIEPPVQTPNWHEYVGHYYQYPTPWQLDWRRKAVRRVFYWLARLERLARVRSIGYCAPNIAAIAYRR
jgi:2-polyprenyl-3-methyl-5-hydroxy-6-metoxy-1,4-benzoquinol methylase